MPVYFIKEAEKGVKLGVWSITEDAAELFRNIILTEKESAIFSTFGSETRKLHWLSYRLLIEKMNGGNFILEYNSFGKPMMIKLEHYVSISHSGDFSAVIISNTARVGIDIEKISQRIERVAGRFLSDEELTEIHEENRLEKLCVCWAAKEAMFKLYGDEHYDFREEIRLWPFTMSTQGTLKGQLCGKNNHKSYTIHYEMIEGYILAYVIE
jgi:phosphopantetheine--protein transferase-like protein